MIDHKWLTDVVIHLGYVGAFAAGFLGSSSLFLAIFPSYLVIPILATQLNPTIVGLLAGLGSGVGQYIHYYIGFGGRYLLSDKRKRAVDKWRNRVEKYGFWLILLFAMTPLTPDDLIWIPLGIIRYPKLKALVGAIIGKTILNLFYAYVGYFGFNIIVENLL